MKPAVVRRAFAAVAVLLLLGSPAFAQINWGISPPGWPGFGYNSMHWGNPSIAAQPLNRIKWHVTVDTNFTGLAHYGSPVVSPGNTVVFPIHTANGFLVEGHRASDGQLIWSQTTGFVTQSSGWLPVCGVTLTSTGRVAIPDSGGRVLIRKNIDQAAGAAKDVVFYGDANYAANPSAYDTNVRINTPITSDGAGNLYFGYVVLGPTPINLQSGLARISATGVCSWVTAGAAAQDASMAQVALNCAPALGYSGQVVYFGVYDGYGHGYMVGLNSATLAPMFRVRLKDPRLGSDAYMIDLSTASPTVGPDGDVYYGIFDDGWNNNDRGWMLHFNSNLTRTLTPGAFGWDHTASIVPRNLVPSYTGQSKYLLLTKYNNYANIGNGDGHNKVALLDPNATEVDPVSGITTMKEVMTVEGVTPDPGTGMPGAVREWCINNAAVDSVGKAAMLNSEDGRLYRWDFTTNSLTQVITLISGAGVPYTPTVIGPDGTVYAINNAELCAVGQ